MEIFSIKSQLKLIFVFSYHVGITKSAFMTGQKEAMNR